MSIKFKIITAILLIGLAALFLPVAWQKTEIEKVMFWKIPNRPPKPLVNSELNTPEVKSVVPSTGKLSAWVLNVNSYANKKQANQLLTHLRKQGFSAYMVATDKHQYNVFIGPYLTKNQLDTANQQLKRQFKLTGKIVDWSTWGTTL